MQEDFIKVIRVTYRILDFFPQGDPLKDRAKEKVLSLLEDLTLLSLQPGAAFSYHKKSVQEIIQNIDILQNYLKLGQGQGWVDNVNVLVLQKEYQALKNSLTPKLQLPPKEPDRESEKTLQPEEKKTMVLSKPFISKELTDRQDKILKMFLVREKLQVADIIKEIPEVTKRTLRRDLDDLLKKGKIIRGGEWNQVSYRLGELGQHHLS